jgi:hypothetical protein
MCNRAGLTETSDDRHRVQMLVHKQLCLPQKFTTQHNNGRRAIADLVILHLRNVWLAAPKGRTAGSEIQGKAVKRPHDHPCLMQFCIAEFQS